jgi:hypothetical protein
MPTYEQNKIHIMKYRTNNRAKYNDYINTFLKQKYSENPELFRKRKNDANHFKKESERLRNILID